MSQEFVVKKNESAPDSSSRSVYKGSSQYDPYLDQIDTLKPTLWDNVIHSLGGKSKYDRQVEDLKLQSKLRYDQLNMLEDETKYNSEVEKASRMRQAGYNPDLMGLGSASESGAYNEPQTTPMSSDYASNGEMFMNVVNIGMSLLSGFSNVTGLMIDNSVKNLSRISSIEDLAKKTLDNSLTPPGVELKENGKWIAYGGDSAFDSLVEEYGSDNVRYSVPQFTLPVVKFLRSRDKRAFNRAIDRYKNNITFDASRYKQYYDYLTSRKDAALASSSPFASPSYRQMEDLFRPISKLMFSLSELDLKYQNEATSNSLEYEQAFDPSSAAANDNAANQSSEQLNEYNKAVNESWNTAMQSVKKFGEKNPVLGMIGVVLLNYLRTNMPPIKIGGSQRQPVKSGKNSPDNNSKSE